MPPTRQVWSIGRVARCGVGALLGFTLGWIAACLLGGGDAQSPLPALLAAAAGGLVLGFLGQRTRSRVGTLILAAGALAALAFWTLAPNGWWARRPPRANEVVVEPAR